MRSGLVPSTVSLSFSMKEHQRATQKSGKIVGRRNVLVGLHVCRLSGPVRDTLPLYRAIPFRDSIAEGGIGPFALFS